MTIENLQTPPGRIVWGHPGKPTIKKDQNTKQPILKDGQPVQQWAFGVAFPKHEFDQHIRPYLEQEARTAYPHGTPPKFSWKYKDGDGIDSNGKPYSLREGHAGCYIMTIATTTFAPPIYKFENGAYRQVTPEEIETGYFVALNLNIKVNVPTNSTHTPGLYVNPNAIEFVAYGEKIMNSVSPEEMFGGRQYQLPAGASATPLANNTGVGMPSAPSGVPQGYAPVQQQAPQGYPAQQPQTYTPQPAPTPMAAPAPQGYPQQQQYAPAPQGYPQTNQPPQGMPAPAPDFIHNAGVPQTAPVAGGYAPQPNATGAGVPGATQYPTNPGMPQGLPQSR